MNLTMTVTGVDETHGKIRNFIKYAQADAQRITNEYGDKFVVLVRQNASGRPGPNIVTGVYVGSIRIVERTQYSATAGTSAPQALRLEFGFVGRDSLGRIYNQPPFPHWHPAMDVITPQFVEAMQQAVRTWWR